MGKQREPEIYGPVMEIECDKCKKPVMILQMTPSMITFSVKCHRCGTVLEAKDWNHPGTPRKIEDEYYQKWQSETR